MHYAKLNPPAKLKTGGCIGGFTAEYMEGGAAVAGGVLNPGICEALKLVFAPKLNPPPRGTEV